METYLAGVALLLRFDVALALFIDPIVELTILLGIYGSSMYGGTLPAVLINTPGTAVNALTTYDGYPMTRRGEAGASCWLIGKTHMRADAKGMARLGLAPDSVIGARQAACGFDLHLGRLLDRLERSGRMADTMIILISDHGDYLGDHWLGEKELFHAPPALPPKDARLFMVADRDWKLVHCAGGLPWTNGPERFNLDPIHRKTGHMNPFDDILVRAKRDPRHIVLAEGGDPRVIDGALNAIDAGIAKITLLGPEAAILKQIEQRGGSDLPVRVVDPVTSPLRERYAAELEALRRHKGIDLDGARKLLENPLYFAAVMVRLNEAEGSIGGAVATTADTVRAAIQVIGIDPRYSLVSSYFLMQLAVPHHQGLADTMVFADCALVVDPDAEALAQIALASADSARTIAGLEPRIAMLSFSTSGSASHPLVDKVIDATRLARTARPDLAIEGEIQLDAALIPAISARKVKGSAIEGRANVLIFPSLESGNIGYKLAERLGGVRAIGPILQGLARPANDLSRGCSADDVFRLIAITSIQAQSAATGVLD